MAAIFLLGCCIVAVFMLSKAEKQRPTATWYEHHSNKMAKKYSFRGKIKIKNTEPLHTLEEGNDKEFMFFFERLKTLITNKDSLQIAEEIFYPLHTALEGHQGTLNINDKKSFGWLSFQGGSMVYVIKRS